jgi:hypothetical protein
MLMANWLNHSSVDKNPPHFVSSKYVNEISENGENLLDSDALFFE